MGGPTGRAGAAAILGDCSVAGAGSATTGGTAVTGASNNMPQFVWRETRAKVQRVALRSRQAPLLSPWRLLSRLGERGHRRPRRELGRGTTLSPTARVPVFFTRSVREHTALVWSKPNLLRSRRCRTSDSSTRSFRSQPQLSSLSSSKISLPRSCRKPQVNMSFGDNAK